MLGDEILVRLPIYHSLILTVTLIFKPIPRKGWIRSCLTCTWTCRVECFEHSVSEAYCSPNWNHWETTSDASVHVNRRQEHASHRNIAVETAYPTSLYVCIYIYIHILLYNVHILYIHRTYIVHCTYTVHILYIYCTYTVHILYIYCTYTVHILYIYCTYTVHILYIYCTYTVHILYIYCTYTVHILYIYCTYTVHILYIYCTYTYLAT